MHPRGVTREASSRETEGVKTVGVGTRSLLRTEQGPSKSRCWTEQSWSSIRVIYQLILIVRIRALQSLFNLFSIYFHNDSSKVEKVDDTVTEYVKHLIFPTSYKD